MKIPGFEAGENLLDLFLDFFLNVHATSS
jgi:hypothetical protein